MRHPSTKTWSFPPDRGADPDRLNLRELAARPDRFEHHLIVVAQIGTVQLELATASEPLYFAHVNISDEYAVALPTGDPLLDAFPMRTFVSDRESGADVGRYNHKQGDLVLHPVGHAHWPGKLRPPYTPLEIPRGMRRCGLSLVYCANAPTPSTAQVVPLPPPRAADVKAYAAPTTTVALSRSAGPTLSLASLSGPPGVIARIGTTTLALVENPTKIGSHGGWLVVLAVDSAMSGVAAGSSDAAAGSSGVVAGRDAAHRDFAGGVSPLASLDLIRIAPGASVPPGVSRALVFAGDAPPDPVPPSWSHLPPPPFPVLEDAPRGELPFAYDGLRVEARSPTTVAVLVEDAVAEVPRYWLARMLFRIALHDLRLNYVETYGGFFVDDSHADIEVGLHIGDRRVAIAIARAEAPSVIERLYRAVAPADYRERLE